MEGVREQGNEGDHGERVKEDTAAEDTAAEDTRKSRGQALANARRYVHLCAFDWDIPIRCTRREQWESKIAPGHFPKQPEASFSARAYREVCLNRGTPFFALLQRVEQARVKMSGLNIGEINHLSKFCFFS